MNGRAGVQFKEMVKLVLEVHGFRVQPRLDARRRPEGTTRADYPDLAISSPTGGVSVEVQAGTGRARWSEQLDAVEQLARDRGDILGALVSFRRQRSAGAQYVLLSLDGFSALLEAAGLQSE